MKRQPTINRGKELAIIENLLTGELPERVLLIQAGGGMGKSVLVRECIQRCPEKVPQVVVDFKGGGVSVAEIFSRTCNRLGWDKLPTLSARIAASVHTASVNIADNKMLGRNQIDIALGGPDEDTRERQRAALADALFADLRGLGRTLFVFDAFEHCSDTPVDRWVSKSFLPRVIDVENIYVVIAGRKTPEPGIDWENISHQISLKGITEPKHWHQFAKEIGITKGLEWIDGFCAALEGHPLDIASMLTSHIPRDGAR